jgi:hypothetical protein
MSDVVMILIGVGFFGLTWLFTNLCARLGKEK